MSETAPELLPDTDAQRTTAAKKAAVRAHPYADFIHKVKKPSRYLGGEHGEIVKDWDAASARMCLCFPDVYEVGMSHLGYKILYAVLNEHPSLLAERAYAPWIDMESELRARGEPLRSLESFHALREFDVLGFSLQFELTFTNILQMLELGGVPLRSEARGEDDPLVIAGGPTATHPEPLAPFLDAVLIGDGEARTPEILLVWRDLKRAGLSRRERLARLAQLEGVYVPSLYDTAIDPDTGVRYVVKSEAHPEAPLPVKRTFLPDISAYPFPKSGPIANTETVFDRVSVEISRGCTEGCRFCQAGMIYRPVRERDPLEIIDVLKHAVRDGGYDAASLTSLSTADYSAISPLIHNAMSELRKERATLSVSSLRAYGLAEDVLDEIKDGGGKGLTFAPEAGTQRMRDVVNKNVTEEQLMETARRVFSRGWSRMKLYFMVGLPTETDEDVLGIVQTGARALAIGRELAGRSAQVTVSVSTHVPKPHTPFQWCAMDTRADVLRKQSLLRDEARRTRVELKMHDSLGSYIEGVIARGDRTLADAIEGAYKRGARFDSWEDQLDMSAWNEAFAEAGIEPSRFLGTIPLTARVPWAHIDVGLEDGFLQREYRKALKNRLSPPCGKAVGMFIHHTNLEAHDNDKKKLVCYDCGVACDMTDMRDQRGVFLKKLGATAPRSGLITLRKKNGDDALGAHDANDTLGTNDASDAAASEPASEPNVDEKIVGQRRPGKGRAAPPIRPDQGPAVRVRLAYRKVGRAAFSSHLDMVRLLPRLFRRLSLPVYYSLGFHSKPVMIFGPALSLGIASLCEYVDIKLAPKEPLDFAALPKLLTEGSVDGIEFYAALPLEDGDARLSQLMQEAEYVAALPRSALAQLGFRDEDELARALGERKQKPLRTRRDIEGVGKWVDVGRYLLDVQVGHGYEALASAGIVGDLVALQIRLAITPDGTAKVSEALETLLGTTEAPVRYVRTRLSWQLDGHVGTPLELGRLRALSPQRNRIAPRSDEAAAQPQDFA